LNVRLDQVKPDISVKLLAPLIQHEAWTAFYSHLVSILLVGSQAGECGTIVNALFDSDYIDAKGFRYLTLNIPARNVPTVSEKRTAKRPKDLIEYAAGRMGSGHARLVIPLLHCFHEQMRAGRRRRARRQPNLWMNLDMRKPLGHLANAR
jgi:hypothetical protein